MYKILIVEDDSTIAEAVRRHLERWGHEVECVTDFAAVLEHFIRFAPQLVLDAKDCQIHLITLEDYERLTGKTGDLEEGQVLLYSTGSAYGYDEMDFMGKRLQVKEVTEPLYPWPCAGKAYLNESYVITVKDEKAMTELVNVWEIHIGQEAVDQKEKTGILLEGEEEEKEGFMKELKAWKDQNGDLLMLTDGVEMRRIDYAMNGGLLFIGILFGMVFFVCLLLIMYYKQLSEGCEDQGSFAIMQKVGMGEEDIKKTVQRQMVLVFAFPLLTAFVHTAVGVCMVDLLMGILRMFNISLLILCAVGVSLSFTVIYLICYAVTSKVYYRVVLHSR